MTKNEIGYHYKGVRLLLQKYFETRLEMIETALKGYLTFDEPHAKDLKAAMQNAVFSGGKRWRPLLLVSIYEMLIGMKKSKLLDSVIAAGCAVEIMHNAALVHDDMPCVMNRKERRNSPALHMQYDNTIAILAGDALYTHAFGVLADIKDPRKAVQAVRILSNYTMSYGLIGGQAVALINKRKVMKINTLRYIDSKKTGALLQAAADIACVMAEADENTRQIMNTYALNLALAHQMIDDIAADYNRGGEGLDGDEEFVPVSRASYTGLLGFDKARKTVEKMLDESERMIKPFAHNDVLVEFIQMIQEKLP